MRSRSENFRGSVRPLLARAGVVAFAFSLLLPTLVDGETRTDDSVLLAGSLDEITPAALERVALPNVREPTQAPAPVPVPVLTVDPTPVPTPRPLAVAAGGPGVLVTASWYGPGFYGNRLPCWQWLQANGRPIQFEFDTWGVANKTLPCGTMLVLAHGANTVTVPVVDRGPYVAGRELDLSPAVKAALGCTDLCTLLVRIP